MIRRLVAAAALVSASLAGLATAPASSTAAAGACHTGIHFYSPSLHRYLAVDDRLPGGPGQLAMDDPGINTASLFRVCQMSPTTFAAESDLTRRWVAVTPDHQLRAEAGGPGPHEIYSRACRGPLVFWAFPSVGEWAEIQSAWYNTVWATALFNSYGLGFISNDGACR